MGSCPDTDIDPELQPQFSLSILARPLFTSFLKIRAFKTYSFFLLQESLFFINYFDGSTLRSLSKKQSTSFDLKGLLELWDDEMKLPMFISTKG